MSFIITKDTNEIVRNTHYSEFENKVALIFFFLIEIIFWSNKNSLDMKRENSAQFDFNSSIDWKKGINTSIHKIELY